VDGHIKAGLADVAIGRTIKVDASDFSNINYDNLIKEAKMFINQ